MIRAAALALPPSAPALFLRWWLGGTAVILLWLG